jgi:glycosyltransferase involved in cell wall biosynthesis
MPKILVVAPFVPHPIRHGGAIRTRVQLDALRADHEVHFAAAVTGAEDLTNLRRFGEESGIAVHELPAVAAPPARLHRKLARWLTADTDLIRRRWSPQARAEFARIEARVSPDWLAADSSYALPVLSRPADLLLLHNLEYALMGRGGSGRRGVSERLTRMMEARGLRRWEQRAVASARLTVTVSEHDRRLASALAPQADVVAVPNSVDLERLPLQDLADPAAPPRLLFVGSMDYPPNLEAATELIEWHAPALRRAYPALTVRLVGKDPFGVAGRFRGVPGVEVVGPVDDLVPHYRDTHAVYMPIRSGGGTRLKILEAWALGVPVLSTAVGAEGLPAEPGRHLLSFETPTAGVAALRDLLAGAGGVLRAAGRQLVEQGFSHRVAIEQLRSHIARSLAGEARVQRD